MQRMLRWWVGTAWLAMVGLLCACGEDDDVCRGPNGRMAAGETFTEDCNTCTCNDDGSISCSEVPDCAACSYEGEDYAVGESWPAGDGCNICQCLSFGEVSCTTTACAD